LEESTGTATLISGPNDYELNYVVTPVPDSDVLEVVLTIVPLRASTGKYEYEINVAGCAGLLPLIVE
jgi:uncharacterized membrane protein